jgi:hypothetical protein
MRIRVLAAAAIVIALLGSAGPAAAVTKGTPDGTGHP